MCVSVLVVENHMRCLLINLYFIVIVALFIFDAKEGREKEIEEKREREI